MSDASQQDRQRKPDDIDWFQGSWEGNTLISLQESARMSFAQKLDWLEEAQQMSEQMKQARKSTLRRALEQWAD